MAASPPRAEGDPSVYAFGDYELDMPRYELRRAGRPCPVEPQVIEVLAYLLAHRDRVVPREELLDAVWGHRFVADATLGSRVMAARRAVGDTGRDQRVLRTVRGRGLRFVAPVEVRRPAAAPPVAVGAPGADGPGPAGMVGRGQELGLLRRRLAEARAGARRLVLVTGDAGLGKSTLVEAALAEVEGEGAMTVLRGQCLERHGAEEPYAAVLDAISSACRGDGGARVAATLARVAPTWLSEMPWLRDAGPAGNGPPAWGATRERMLREGVMALEALAAERPLVLALEDLHWSDAATVDLLAALAWRRGPAPLAVLGTLRVPDAEAGGHPLRALQEELALRGLCEEVALGFLGPDAVARYLAERLGVAEPPEGLARVLHERTDGNPLFMENVLTLWRAGGGLAVDEDGRCTLARPLEEVARAVPEGVRQVIARRLGDLPAGARRLVDAAAIAGREHSAAEVAAALGEGQEEVEERLGALAREGRFLRPAGVADFPDGTVAARFAFTHHLYREVVHDAVPPERAARLHLAVGRRLEEALGAAAPERAAELARHFALGRDVPRAVTHMARASEAATRRGAHGAAAAALRDALTLMEGARVPDAERTELRLQALLGRALVATQGWSSRDGERALRRALELARGLGDPAQLGPVLYDLAGLHEHRGEYAASQALLEERLGLGSEARGARGLETYELLACSVFHQGAFGDALAHAERGLRDAPAHGPAPVAAGIGADPLVACHEWAALSLWCLGRPDEALERIGVALRLAEDPARAYARANAHAQAARLRQLRGEAEPARHMAERALELAGQGGFAYVAASARMLLGWARAAGGAREEGAALLAAGLAEHEATGARMDRPYFLGLLAEALARCGRTEDASSTLERALGEVAAGRPFFYAPELLRLRGEMLAAGRGADAVREGQAELRRALEAARAAGARSLELRVAVSIGRLAGDPSARREAAALVRRAREGLVGGADTPDAREADALLAALLAAPAGPPVP